MVKLEEVVDEDFVQATPPTEDNNDWDTDSETASMSSVSSDAPDETLAERIAALQDIVPPSTRRYVQKHLSTAGSWLRTGFVFGGKAAWVVSATLMLIAVPMGIAHVDEQQYVEMEREAKMAQSQADILTPGSTVQVLPPPESKPAP